jgi:hypothetical protein
VGEAMAGPGVRVGYAECENMYYVNSSDGHQEVLRAVLTAPWVHRDADNFDVTLCVRNESSGAYAAADYKVNRYNLAGWWGRLLMDCGDAACKAGVVAALVDAFLWLRMALSSSSFPGVSPLYVVVGFLVGVSLYALGLYFKYLYGRFYGRTPAAELAEAPV